MQTSSSTTDSGESLAAAWREDLMVLTKARLSFLVIVTTFVGFLLASGSDIDWLLLVHTLFGSALTALGAAVFNQLMEIDSDARMRRTQDRPLPAGRIPPVVAFGIGWLLAAFGLVHLGIKVNIHACYLAAATLLIYLFIYTPLKRRSSTNTLVGAVSGAIPPLIGWVGAGGGYGVEAAFLFGLLFLWQLPHFLAINWMYRDQYREAGFVMWSNQDESGALTSGLAVFFSALLVSLMAVPWWSGVAGWPTLAGGLLLSLGMLILALRFRRVRDRAAARKLFFYTLIYLPAILVVLVVFWK